MKQWSTESNGQEKTFYSLANIPRVYFAKHTHRTKRKEYNDYNKHAIAIMYSIEQRYSDHNVCIVITKNSNDDKVRSFIISLMINIGSILMMQIVAVIKLRSEIKIFCNQRSCNNQLLKLYFMLNRLFNSTFTFASIFQAIT